MTTAITAQHLLRVTTLNINHARRKQNGAQDWCAMNWGRSCWRCCASRRSASRLTAHPCS